MQHICIIVGCIGTRVTYYKFKKPITYSLPKSVLHVFRERVVAVDGAVCEGHYSTEATTSLRNVKR